jgi:hypothetical protein
MSVSLAIAIRIESHLIMSKKQYYLRREIEDARNADKSYRDKNFEQFSRLIIDRLLFYIADIPFRWIINEYLNTCDYFCDTVRINSHLWFYTADFKLINGWITYSFRFPNACYSGLYNSFNVEENHLFQPSTKQRHRSNVWYNYKGQKLLQYIGEYLDIAAIVRGERNPYTKLFVNQEEKRIDIYFYFTSISTKVTITFENGSPL